MSFQLFLAILLGGMVGYERDYHGKAAGVRTFSLVSAGATLFTLISLHGFEDFLTVVSSGYDPARVAAQVVMGVGFIGAGLIVFRGTHVEGLTTAAGLWVAAAIGMAVAVEFYFVATFTTILTLAVLYILKRLEPRLLKIAGGDSSEPNGRDDGETHR